MKLFIWEKIENLTTRYHGDAALVIVAKDKKAARAAFSHSQSVKFPEAPRRHNEVTLIDPTYKKPLNFDDAIIIDMEKPPEHPRLWVFPDAGCC